MRKLALLAMLALVIGMVPMATAGGQVDAQANGTVHFVNANVNFQIDICDGSFPSNTLVDDLAFGEAADVELPGGAQDIYIALDPNDCTAGPTTLQIVPPINVVGGQETTSILGPSAGLNTTGVNDTSTTPADTARLTMRNGVLGGPNTGFCIDGALVDGTETVPGAQNQVEVPAGAVDELALYVQGSGCTPGEPATLAACTNLVFNVFATAQALDVDNQLFIVGCELPTSDMNVSQFCTTLNPDLQAAGDAIDNLFAGVDPDNEATYPSPDAVQAVVDQINAALAAGDASVPDTVRPQWEIVSGGLRDLVAGLTAASYDLANIGPDGVADIVDGLDEPPSAETTAATDVLTEWYLANCIPEGAPTFTG